MLFISSSWALKAKEDISEENDLSKKMPQKVQELNEKLEAWLKSVKAKMLRPNPDHKTSD